jgi:hypothetical protein
MAFWGYKARASKVAIELSFDLETGCRGMLCQPSRKLDQRIARDD